MFAYVKFAHLDSTESKKKVPVDNIQYFNPDSYEKKRFYKVKYNSSYNDAQVLFVAETEPQLDKLIIEKRCSTVPSRQMKPAYTVQNEKEHKNAKNVEKQNGSRRNKRKRSETVVKLSNNKEDSQGSKQFKKSLFYDSKSDMIQIPKPSFTSHSSTLDPLSDNINCCRHIEEITNLKKQLNIIADDLEKVQHKLYIKTKKLNDKDRILKENFFKLKKFSEDLNEKEKELVEIRQLNRQLQQKAFNVSEINISVPVEQKPFELKSVEKMDQNPMVGDIRKKDGMIYIGRGKWIKNMTYTMVTNSIKRNSPGKFVKNMTSVMFSKDVLMKSTVSGQKSNRDKKNNLVDKLDPLTIQAIKDIFRFWLTKTMKFPSDFVESEVDKTKTYISKKIADLKRAKNTEESSKRECKNKNDFQKLNRINESSSSSSSSNNNNDYIQSETHCSAVIKVEDTNDLSENSNESEIREPYNKLLNTNF